MAVESHLSSSGAPPRSRRLRRIWRHPITLVAIVFVLAIDAIRSDLPSRPPGYSPVFNFVAVGQWIEDPYLAMGAPIFLRAFRTPGGGFEIQCDDKDTPLPLQAAEVSGCRAFKTATWRTGYWGMTSEVRAMYIEPNYTKMSPVEIAAFPGAVLAGLKASPNAAQYAEEIQFLSSGILKRSRGRWQGYLHSGIIVALVLVLVAGIAANVYRLVFDWRFRRRLARGVCPVCVYDLRSNLAICPECGWQMATARTTEVTS